MPRPVLILLNGAPASGKSTLARAWAERHGAELPLAIDVDVVRSMLGGWQAEPVAAGLAARALSLAAIRTQLAAGRDVVVPQYLRRPEFIDQLREAAGASAFLECVLVVDAPEAARRFEGRHAEALRASGPHSPVVHGALIGDSMDAVVDDFESFVSGRQAVVRLKGSLVEMLDELDAVVMQVRD